MDILKMLTQEFHLKTEQVESTLKLIDDGNTIPFIARYRKEVTGSLDDQVLRELNERLLYLRGLQKRQEEVISSIRQQEKMTDELMDSILSTKTLAELEDVYRPYKQKRKTRASVAREKGLEPLAKLILEQYEDLIPLEEAALYLDEENGLSTPLEALSGALDIIAEDISDSAEIRKLLRAFIIRSGNINSKAANPDLETVYSMYYDYSEPVNKIVGHRILALERGEKESALKVSVSINLPAAISIISKKIIKWESPSKEVLLSTCEDSFNRLIFPSLEREIRNSLFENASEQAIKVFSSNLKQLLMQPPVKGSVTLGLDPAYRTGCKIAVVDDTGKVLDTTVIYPTPPQSKVEQSKETIKKLIAKHGVSTISIGNGTASRESEAFVAELIKEIPQQVSYMVVSEAGASVYSASKLAATEFPQFDVSLRSAVSIARRMQDPLAELVKIDPKAIGVGQYQHDMPKARLDEALGGVVESCVNSVGVDLNTASETLLTKVAGINSAVAKNIVLYREENGAFTDRKQLMKVNKLGAKAFTQCAGFLRVSGGDNVLDNTGVHPESYKATTTLI
ncbi:MAG: Tex family protein, partial [Oscillospiraceae bacterium]